MKKSKIRNLKLSKHTIAKIKIATQQKINGGTDPVSPPHDNRHSAYASHCGNQICF